MLKKILSVLLLLTTAFYYSCKKDIIAKDITKQTVNIVAPADSLKTPYNSVTFWWQEVDGADKYNIQIVKPSFSNIQQLISDTNVVGVKYTTTLQPGTYQWRIRAMNNGGNTVYTTRTLIIDTTSNLQLLTVGLISPADSITTNQLQQSFNWSLIPAATSYTIDIVNSTGASVGSSSQSTNTFNYTFTVPGTYTWKVRAGNNNSLTQYSSRTIVIDTTGPLVPILFHPANNVNISLGDSLVWQRSAISGAIYDTLYVVSSSDSTFLFPPYLVTAKETGLYMKVQDSTVFPRNKNYFWRVRSFDAAGNHSVYSAIRKFHVN